MGSIESEGLPGRLEISGGKLVTFENTRKSNCKGKIVVKGVQDSEPNLTVYRVTKCENIYLAFCFEQNQKKYVLGLEGETICFKINTHNEINDFNNKFLFRWDSPKDSFGTLSSVDEPRRYLCVHGKEVTVDRKPDYHFKVVTNTMNLETRCSSVISEGNACHTRMLCYTMEPPSKVKKQSRKRKLKV